MSKHPKLAELEYLFAQGDEVCFSGREYEEKTGAALPKNNDYIMKRSALMRWADENGYIVADVQENAVIEKIITLKKK